MGEELLVPTRIYSGDCLALLNAAEVHAMSHVTGGGLANNLARVVPDSIRVRIDRASWAPAPIFDLVQAVGRVSQPDLEATLNMGVGMVALVAPDAVDQALATLAERGLPAWVCGEAEAVVTGEGARVVLHGSHRPA